MKKFIIWSAHLLLINLYSLTAFAGMNINMRNLPWYLKANNIESCWDRGWYGDKVTVEVWDSKVNFDSPLLKNKKYGKANYDGLDNCSKEKHVAKTMLHGTAMASLIVADYGKAKCFIGAYACSCNKDEEIFVAGVAPYSKILNREISDSCGNFSKDNRFQQLLFSLELKKKTELENSVNEYGENIFISPQDIKEAKTVLVSASFVEGIESYSELGTIRKHENFKHLLIVAGVPNIVKKLDKTNLQKPASLKFIKGFDVIAVGATNKYENNKMVDILSYDNEEGYAGVAYGDVIDILAPGEKIPFLIYTSDGCISDGSSEATAIVSGTLALLASCNPHATAAELKQALLENSDKHSHLKGKVNDGSVLNIYKAVNKYCSSQEKIIEDKEDKKEL